MKMVLFLNVYWLCYSKKNRKTSFLENSQMLEKAKNNYYCKTEDDIKQVLWY